MRKCILILGCTLVGFGSLAAPHTTPRQCRDVVVTKAGLEIQADTHGIPLRPIYIASENLNPILGTEIYFHPGKNPKLTKVFAKGYTDYAYGKSYTSYQNIYGSTEALQRRFQSLLGQSNKHFFIEKNAGVGSGDGSLYQSNYGIGETKEHYIVYQSIQYPGSHSLDYYFYIPKRGYGVFGVWAPAKLLLVESSQTNNGPLGKVAVNAFSIIQDVFYYVTPLSSKRRRSPKVLSGLSDLSNSEFQRDSTGAITWSPQK